MTENQDLKRIYKEFRHFVENNYQSMTSIQVAEVMGFLRYAYREGRMSVIRSDRK